MKTKLQESIKNLVGFHLAWSVFGLITTLVIGLFFNPAKIKAASIDNFSATRGLAVRLPDNFVLWCILVITGVVRQRVAAVASRFLEFKPLDSG